VTSWRPASVGDLSLPKGLVGGPFGSDLGRVDYREAGVPVIRGSNFTDGRYVDVSDLVFVDSAKALSLQRNTAHPGDLVFTQRGTLGQVGMIPASSPYPEFVISQSQMRLTCDPVVADPQFVYYAFRSPNVVTQIEAAAIRTALPHINLGILRNIRLPLPPLIEQKAIVETLGALDDKIDANRRETQILVDATMTAYRAIAAQANSSELIELVASVRGGSTPSTDSDKLWNPGVHFWATPRDMTTLRSPVLWRTERKISDEGLASISSGLLPKGTVLLSSRAPIGYLAITAEPVAVNQGFIALVPNGRLSSEYLCCWVKASMSAIEALGNGTTFMEVSKRSFRVLRVPIPPDSLLSKFESFARPVFQLILNLERQIVHLALVRDLLLPKLISGEIRAAKTRRAAEAGT